MKSIATSLAAVCVSVFLGACSSTSINVYSSNSPKLIAHQFFNGDLTAHGVVKNRSGKVIRYFNATIKAYWEDGVGTLEEKFIFNDGEIQFRTWKLVPSKTGEADFLATAGDVIGEGKGQTSGNAFNLAYVLSVKYNKSTINVKVDDWMWLVDEKTLLNESTLTKFGFKVGSVQLVIVKN
jgi:Protein of unknown function (DUF3833)